MGVRTLSSYIMEQITEITLGPAYSQFDYYEHPAITTRLFDQKSRLLIDISVWKVQI